MNHEAPREIFATYSDTNELVEPIINVCEDRSAFELTRAGAKIFNRVVSVLHNDSTREDDPILTILCITNERINKQLAGEISQVVIDWLMDNGHMKKRLHGEQ